MARSTSYTLLPPQGHHARPLTTAGGRVLARKPSTCTVPPTSTTSDPNTTTTIDDNDNTPISPAMDQQAANLLTLLRRTSAATEAKLTQLNTLKSDIKHYRVPDNAQPIIFECLKLAISQQTSSSIVTAAFSTLSHLIKRLKIQDAHGTAIVAHAPKLYSALQERLGDARESNRLGAQQALSDLWPFCSAEIERMIREDAISGGHARAKEAGMQWVVKMHHDVSLPFKGFVPLLVLNLEDSDGNVRDAAKSAVIDLFSDAPAGAKADLKRQLKIHGIRYSIVEQILKQIDIAPAPEVDLAASTRSLPAFDHVAAFSESINSEAAKPPPKEEAPVDPLFVHTSRELEDMFRDMAPCFEGKEEEFNWMQRDKSITKMRRLTKGNAPSEYHAVYMHGIKTLQEGILKAANSLRTTMSTNGCQLVQELARSLGPAIDPMTEIYLQSFIKMSAATKHIAAQNGNTTVETIFQYVSYNVRLMQHVWLAAQDKNVQPRQFSAAWLRTILERQAGAKSHFESSGGLELAEKVIKKGLSDANPKVKESMRATYWTFAKVFPGRAATIMSTLDPKAQQALEKDPNNPNASLSASKSAFSASTTSRAGGAQSRSSLRDAIAAQKRKAALSMPDRPNSAMANLSPARPSQSTSNLRAARPTATLAHSQTAAARVPSTSSTASGRSADSSSTSSTMKGSLMSGPVRRPRPARPELPRPATADPYASRRLLRPETPSNRSPANSPPKTGVMRPTAASAAREQATRQESPAPSPMRRTTPQPVRHSSPHASRVASPQIFRGASPRQARADSRPPSKGSVASFPDEPSLEKEDDFTIVLPPKATSENTSLSHRRPPMIPQTMSVDSGIPAISEDDNFTMVLPSLHSLQRQTSPLAQRTERERSPLATRSPMRSTSEETPAIPSALADPKSPLTQRSPIRSISEEAAAAPLPPSVRPSHSPAQRVRSTPERTDSPITDVPGSIQRQGSPLKSSAFPAQQQQEELQIYEDPFTAAPPGHPNPEATTKSRPASPEKHRGVLNELPVTGNNKRPDSPPTLQTSPRASASASTSPQQNGESTNGVVSPPLSPTSKAEAIRSRKLLASALERIRAHTLDAHGFRRVLDLARAPEPADVFGSDGRRFNELLAALLEFLAAEGVKAEGKRQAVGLLKVLLTRAESRKWNAQGRWSGRALRGVLDARRVTEGVGLLVKDLEGLGGEVVRVGRTEEGVEAVCRWVEEALAMARAKTMAEMQQSNGDNQAEEQEPAKKKPEAQATALALRTLTALLATPVFELDKAENPALKDRIAALAAKHLDAPDAEVRKADVELATELYLQWPEAKEGEDVDADKKAPFWRVLEKEGLQEGMRGLVLYYIARREKGVA